MVQVWWTAGALIASFMTRSLRSRHRYMQHVRMAGENDWRRQMRARDSLARNVRHRLTWRSLCKCGAARCSSRRATGALTLLVNNIGMGATAQAGGGNKRYRMCLKPLYSQLNARCLCYEYLS